MKEEIENIKASLRDHHERLKRLESPVGSGAPSGFAAAERAGTRRAEEEERSDEPQSLAVSPGEAEAAILRAIEWNKNAAAHHRLEASCAVAENLFAHARFHKSRELQHSDDSAMLEKLLPKPDSEATKERSGRRNAKGDAPGANGKPLL